MRSILRAAQLALAPARTIVYLTLAAFSLNSTAALAAVSGFGSEEIAIPQTPTAPPSLVQPIPVDPFHCQRTVIFQGKTLDCDTNVRRDAENLRPIIKDVPSAVAELDTFQSNKRTLRYTAYTASAGLLVALVGYFGSRGTNGFRNANGGYTPAALVTLAGLTVTAGSFVFGFVIYKTNESHLANAVNNFNLARPDTPIELQFKTGFSF